MSAPAPPRELDAPSDRAPLTRRTSPQRPAKQRWWSRRPGLAAGLGAVAVLLLVVLLTLLAAGTSRGDDLDPRSAKPTGTLALAELLNDRDVPTDRGAAAQPGGTFVVPFAGRFDVPELQRVLDGSSTASRVVLLSAAEVPGTGVQEGRLQGVSAREPACALPAATVAGAAEVGGRTYSGASTSCYGGSLVLSQRGAPQIVVLGSPTFLTNESLGEQGNAALALGLFTGAGLPGPASTSVTWYQPALDPQAEPPGLVDLLPDSVPWAVLQLALAVAVLALWRGRRLGPVVEEPLPVVVPAAETVEGRARLYAAGRARTAAAEALRAGARARLGNALEHGGEPDPTGLVNAVAARSGRQPGEIAALLYGSAGAPAASPNGPGGPGMPTGPNDDAELIRLADQIDQLEREVRAR